MVRKSLHVKIIQLGKYVYLKGHLMGLRFFYGYVVMKIHKIKSATRGPYQFKCSTLCFQVNLSRYKMADDLEMHDFTGNTPSWWTQCEIISNFTKAHFI